MDNLQDIIDKYNSLSEQMADPKNISRLEELGTELSDLEDKKQIATEILDINKRIEDSEVVLASGDTELQELATEELRDLRRELEGRMQEFDTLSRESEKSGDSKSAIIEIRSAAGGDEAKIWAEDLKRMYLRFAESLGLKFESIEENTIIIKGRHRDTELPPGPYGIFKYESGVHRVQRVPETESQGRIHTSTASVAVLPEVEEREITIRDEDIEWQFFRSGGKGGQNVNKVNTAVRLTHNPSGIVVVSTAERYQQRNREIALSLLRSKLWEIEETKRISEIEAERKDAVGRGMRAEKIRTYNYPQNRVTDHRINKSWHNLPSIMDGNLKEVILDLHSI